jgi:8-oxo-dGTP pyrophosphatase MutT (NUDIX family)
MHFEDSDGVRAPMARLRQRRCHGQPTARLLLPNERAEWELAGNRLEPADATPEFTMERETEEENG